MVESAELGATVVLFKSWKKFLQFTPVYFADTAEHCAGCGSYALRASAQWNVRTAKEMRNLASGSTVFPMTSRP